MTLNSLNQGSLDQFPPVVYFKEVVYSCEIFFNRPVCTIIKNLTLLGSGFLQLGPIISTMFTFKTAFLLVLAILTFFVNIYKGTPGGAKATF